MSDSEIDKVLNDFEEKFEKSKNETSEKLLQTIQSHQEVIPELTKANIALFRRVNKLLNNEEVEIPLDVLAFLIKNMAEFTNKNLASAINAFKSESSPQSEKKQKLAKPGVNSLLDETTNSIISKEQIKDAKEINKSLQESKSLQEHVASTTNLIKEFNEEHPEENS